MTPQSKSYLHSLLLFVALLLLIAMGVEIGLSRVDTSFDKKRMLFNRLRERTEILVVGNSHIFWGVSPKEFSRPAFNLGMLMQSPTVGARLVEKLASKMPQLKTVLVGISYFSMEILLSDSEEAWRNFSYTRYFGIMGDGGFKDLLDLRNYSLFFLFGRETSISFLSQGFKRTDLSEKMDEYGWAGLGVTSCDTLPVKEIEKRMAIYARLMKPEHIRSNQEKLQDLVHEVSQRGIRVALVTPPVCDIFAKMARPEALARMTESMNQLVQNSPAGSVVYKNFFRDDRFVPKDFVDGDHLAEEGAEKFSRILDKEIVQPLFSPARDLSSP